MSRIGKQPVSLPAGVKAAMSGRQLTVEKGALKLTQWIDPTIDVAIADGSIKFTRKTDERRERALHGLYCSLANNMVKGLVTGYEKRLEIHGVGFGAKVQGKVLELTVGFAEPAKLKIPDGVKVECPDATKLVIKGHDKHMVGQFAADVRRVRKPEPYKGKGIRYADEVVRRKAGKTVGAGAAGG